MAAAVEAKETLAWEAAKASNTIASFQTYLANYPEGTFATDGTTAVATLRQDDGPFQAAQAAATRAAFETFLNNFPGHAREPDARQAIADMTQGADIVSLRQAAKVEVEAEGSGIQAVALRIRRTTPHPIVVRIPVGTFFVARDSGVQNMVTTEEAQTTLDTTDWLQLSVEAACANRPRDIPGAGDGFSVVRSPQQAELQQLMPALRAEGAPYDVRQAAVWIVTDDSDYGDLGILVSGFGGFGPRVIDETEAARAMKIVADSGIDIRRKAIWRDRATIAEGVQDAALRSWLMEQ